MIKRMFVFLICGFALASHSNSILMESCIDLGSDLESTNEPFNLAAMIKLKINKFIDDTNELVDPENQTGQATIGTGKLCLQLPQGGFEVTEFIDIRSAEFKAFSQVELILKGHSNGTLLKRSDTARNYSITLEETDAADDTARVILKLQNIAFNGGPVARVIGAGAPSDDPKLVLSQVRIRGNASCMPSIWVGKNASSIIDDPILNCPANDNIADEDFNEKVVGDEPSLEPEEVVSGPKLDISDSAIFDLATNRKGIVYADRGTITTVSSSIIDSIRRVVGFREGCEISATHNFIESIQVAAKTGNGYTTPTNPICSLATAQDEIRNHIIDSTFGDPIRDYVFKSFDNSSDNHPMIDKGKVLTAGNLSKDLANAWRGFSCFGNHQDLGPFEYQLYYDLNKSQHCSTEVVSVTDESVHGEYNMPLSSTFNCRLNDDSKNSLGRDFSLLQSTNTLLRLNDATIQNSNTLILPYSVDMSSGLASVRLSGPAFSTAGNCVNDKLFYRHGNLRPKLGLSTLNLSTLQNQYNDEESFINATISGPMPSHGIIKNIRVCLTVPAADGEKSYCHDISTQGVQENWTLQVSDFFVSESELNSANINSDVEFTIEYLDRFGSPISELAESRQVFVSTIDLMIANIIAFDQIPGIDENTYFFDVVLNKTDSESCSTILSDPEAELSHNYFNVASISSGTRTDHPLNASQKTHSVCRYQVTVNQGYPSYRDRLRFSARINTPGASDRSTSTPVEFNESFFGSGGAYSSSVQSQRTYRDKIQQLLWRQTAQGSHHITRLEGVYESETTGKQGSEGNVSGYLNFHDNECIIAARVAFEDTTQSNYLSNIELMTNRRNRKITGIHQALDNAQEFSAPPGYFINGFDLKHGGEASGMINRIRPRYSLLPAACLSAQTRNTCEGSRSKPYCESNNSNIVVHTYSQNDGMAGLLGIPALGINEYLKGLRFSPSNSATDDTKWLFDGYEGSLGNKLARPTANSVAVGALCVSTEVNDKSAAVCNSRQWQTQNHNRELILAPRGYYINQVTTYSGSGGQGIFKVEVSFAPFDYTNTIPKQISKELVPIINY